MYGCVEFSSVLVCQVETPLLSYGYFTGCRLKGRENVSCHHDADVTSQKTLLLTLKKSNEDSLKDSQNIGLNETSSKIVISKVQLITHIISTLCLVKIANMECIMKTHRYIFSNIFVRFIRFKI